MTLSVKRTGLAAIHIFIATNTCDFDIQDRGKVPMFEALILVHAAYLASASNGPTRYQTDANENFPMDCDGDSYLSDRAMDCDEDIKSDKDGSYVEVGFPDIKAAVEASKSSAYWSAPNANNGDGDSIRPGTSCGKGDMTKFNSDSNEKMPAMKTKLAAVWRGPSQTIEDKDSIISNFSESIEQSRKNYQRNQMPSLK